MVDIATPVYVGWVVIFYMEIWRRNLYILMTGQFLVFGSMSMIIPFLPLYLKDMGIQNSDEIHFWSGLIFGVNFLSALIMSPIWGRLGDKYGRKMMILRSSIGMGVIITFMGFVTSPIQLLILRFLNGTVSGFIPSSISLVSTNTPKEKIGYALGLLQSGGVAGSITGPLLGGVLAEAIGFRFIFFITAVMLFIASGIVFFFVKEESKPVIEERRSFVKDTRELMKDSDLIILFLLIILVQFSMLGTAPQIGLFVTELGVPGGYIVFFSGLVIAITGFSNMLTSPYLGKLGDKKGSNKVLFFCTVVASLLFVCHIFVESIWQLLFVRFSLGLCLGGLMPSLTALIRLRAPQGQESMVFGYSTSALCFGSLIGPISLGFISSIIGIRGIFLITSIILALGAVITKLWVFKQEDTASKKTS